MLPVVQRLRSPLAMASMPASLAKAIPTEATETIGRNTGADNDVLTPPPNDIVQVQQTVVVTAVVNAPVPSPAKGTDDTEEESKPKLNADKVVSTDTLM